MNDAGYRPGLGGGTSVGPAGLFRPMAEEDIFTLGTVVWRRGWFVTPGRQCAWLFSIDLPEEYSLSQHGRSWTGKTVRYAWPDGGCDLELRTTLPGPLFRLTGTELSLWFAYPNEPRKLLDLETGGEVGLRGARAGGQVYLLPTREMPTLIVTTAPAEVSVASHRHWRLRFDQPGEHVLVAPLLDEADIPADAETMDLWKRLTADPPRTCEESFRFEGDRLHLRQRFDGAALAVRSPLIANALGHTSLLAGEPGRMLCRTYLGPYTVVEGDTVETTLATDWMDYRMVPTRPVDGALSDWPDTMAFPGDGTWDAEAPMDQLMAWRVWGPLVAAMDPTLREQLRQRLGLPTPERLAESLRTIDEPACGRRWAMDATIFAPSGDVNYDADWYNGLTLSGLARAATCDDPEIAAAAGALSRAVRPQRDLLTAYYEIYHDWRFCSAWTDAQGTLWNIDCAQNGLEGLLGEMRLRRLDDDTDGQEWIRYLAATSAAGIFASLYLPEWLAQSKLTFGDVETLPDTWGLRGTYPHLRAGWADPFTKNPYPLPRYLPEYSALIRLHGPVDRLRDLARKWERDYPHRYEDWQRFYFQPRPDEADLMRSRTISDDPPGTVPCEVGDWAAALHHVFPEIALRMWVFDEDPDEVEARYVRPPALAEQLVLRGGYVLRRDAQPAG